LITIFFCIIPYAIEAQQTLSLPENYPLLNPDHVQAVFGAIKKAYNNGSAFLSSEKKTTFQHFLMSISIF
jgi:hypothetical protein